MLISGLSFLYLIFHEETDKCSHFPFYLTQNASYYILLHFNFTVHPRNPPYIFIDMDFIPIPKKGNAKNAQTTSQLHSSHTLVK